MSEEDVTAAGQRPASLMARIGLATVLLALLVGALHGLVHTSVRTINPAQERRDQHFTGDCALCHTVSVTAPLVRK